MEEEKKCEDNDNVVMDDNSPIHRQINGGKIKDSIGYSGKMIVEDIENSNDVLPNMNALKPPSEGQSNIA